MSTVSEAAAICLECAAETADLDVLFDLGEDTIGVTVTTTCDAEAEIEDALARRKAARADKDFATSDAIRDTLAAKGVEVMDGDPLGWEWKL